MPADEYACAETWTALSAAHALLTGELAAALASSAGLSSHEFEVLLRVAAHAADGGPDRKEPLWHNPRSA